MQSNVPRKFAFIASGQGIFVGRLLLLLFFFELSIS